MDNDFLDSLQNYSIRYINETIDYARQNPTIFKGMLVKVHSYDDPRELVDIGTVENVYWDCFYSLYCADVVTNAGIIRGVLSSVLSPMKLSGSVLRFALKSGVIQGGVQ